MGKILRIVLVLLLMPAAVWAQQKGTIVLKSVAELEVAQKNDKGEMVKKESPSRTRRKFRETR